MGNLMQDVKYALRVLAKSPGFTAVAIATLALGIGANTAIFSLIDQIMLRPLPLEKPEQLIVLRSEGPMTGRVTSDGDTFTSWSYPMYKGLRDGSKEAVELFARYAVPLNSVVQGQAERVNGELVTGNYFQALRVPPAMGRVLSPQDDVTPGQHTVAVLSHHYWVKRFGANPGILNQSVSINGQAMTIVGVARPGFTGVQVGSLTDIFVPMMMKAQMTPNWDGLPNWNHWWLAVLGRVKDGVSREKAVAAMNVAYKPLLEQYLTETKSKWSEKTRKRFLEKKVEALPGASGRPILSNDSGTPLKMLMGMVGLVLLIACANVANLLIARGVARQREMAVRLALGASRGQLIRQLLVEAVMLAMAGGVAGLILAFWTVDALLRAISENMQVLGLSASVDARILSFNMGLALLTGIVFGLLPALRATRPDLSNSMKDTGSGATAGGAHTRFRKGLVITQMALTCVLLVAAGLFAKSFYNLRKHDLGLKTDHLLQFQIAPELSGYNPQRTSALIDRLLERLNSLPGVTTASSAVIPVLANSTSTSNFTPEGYKTTESENPHAVQNFIGPRYFATMGIPLLRGREFTVQDGAASPKVAIINETLANKYFKGDALGRKFGYGTGEATKLEIEVVGVVKNSKHANVKEEERPFAYHPYTQLQILGSTGFYVRTASDPAALASTIRKEVALIDSQVPVFDVKTVQTQIRETLFAEELLMVLAVSFGVLAAALAAIGISGVMAYSVARRTREIGIRIALGAATGDVHWLVFREVSFMTVFGLLLGVPAAYFIGKLSESVLFGVKAGDPSMMGVAVAMLVIVAVVSGFLPARRAARIDPMVALRYE